MILKYIVISRNSFYFQQIYNIIQDSGTQGIWIKDIRTKCNLHDNIITKIVKKFENKKVIKKFSPVSVRFYIGSSFYILL